MSNAPISVTELTSRIKSNLEQEFSQLRLCGEVSRMTRHASGHIYFTIKDAHASISAVIWRSTAVRLKLQPKEGEEFIFSGSISVYEPRGTYQLVVRKVEAVGAGQLAAEFERRKALFAERGWFDMEAKKQPPELPSHIGIVTSPTSAAFEDVKKVLSTRPAWLKLILAPAVVQGDAAAASIVKAIHQLQNMDLKPDVILLVRGGGSMEDLWCFNDEIVVNAIVESNIPIISGIGHEIDTTLADFAADMRAATPSNAAELACPDRDSLRNKLPRIPLLQTLAFNRLRMSQQHQSEQLTQLRHHWQNSQTPRFQHSERALGNLVNAQKSHIKWLRKVSNELRHRLVQQEPRTQLRRRQQKLALCQQHLTSFQMHGTSSQRHQIEQSRQQLIWLSRKNSALQQQMLTGLKQQLVDLGPKQVLKRGYSMTTSASGQLIASATQIKKNDNIHIHFHDGDANAKTISVSKSKTA
ncbi:MAG: exodeoxyribonuclease VII large subunit [Mariprofundaceae bacterium]